jgi:predicted nuclease of predicted toxin-antitoxin system
MIRLLLDQGLPRSAASILRERGYDIVHVAEVGLRDAKDIEIIHQAREHGRVIVTLDADFHALLMVGGHESPSVIRFRLEGLKGRELANLIEQVLATVDHDVKQGALVTINEKTIRVHRL